jgi:hypothetical protein
MLCQVGSISFFYGYGDLQKSNTRGRLCADLEGQTTNGDQYFDRACIESSLLCLWGGSIHV